MEASSFVGAAMFMAQDIRATIVGSLAGEVGHFQGASAAQSLTCSKS
jgi:hypothetical protein